MPQEHRILTPSEMDEQRERKRPKDLASTYLLCARAGVLLLVVAGVIFALTEWTIFQSVMVLLFLSVICGAFYLAYVRLVHLPTMHSKAEKRYREAEAKKVAAEAAALWMVPAVGDRQVVTNRRYRLAVYDHSEDRYNYKVDVNELQEQLALPAPTIEQPPLETIVDELTPNTMSFAYGRNVETGELVSTTLPKAVHIQMLGATGQGKSRQATSILTQLCSRNDTAHLQLALIDCEGETTAPFQALSHVRYHADEPRDAAKAFRALVQELERRDATRTTMPVMLIFVEEFLNLRRTMPEGLRDQALEDYTTLALRGRKRGLFLFSIGQTAYTERHIRDAQLQYLSSMAFAIKPTAARAAGFTNTELLNKLYAERRPGQFLLERPAGDAILLAPYVDHRLISDILGRSLPDIFQPQQYEMGGKGAETAWEKGGKGFDTSGDTSVRDVLRDIGKRLRSGESRSDILRSYGATSGRAYQEIGAVIDALEQEQEA